MIAEENIQDNALDVGTYLLDQLKVLKSKHEIVGDVRGRGLFIGVELMRDLESLTPATEEANTVVNQMKDSGILISSDGPDHNVLKIKPPIIFTRENADTMVVNLAAIINELSKD